MSQYQKSTKTSAVLTKINKQINKKQRKHTKIANQQKYIFSEDLNSGNLSEKKARIADKIHPKIHISLLLKVHCITLFTP